MTFTTDILPTGIDTECPFDFECSFIFDIGYVDGNRELQIRTVEHRSEVPLNWAQIKRIAADEYGSTEGAIGGADVTGVVQITNSTCKVLFKGAR